jgi:hypothetical protein
MRLCPRNVCLNRLASRTEFEVPLSGLIHKYFTDAIRKGKQQGLPKASLEVIRDNHALWTGSWHVEFACDMVATYWCGPAYGLANLRLSATRGDYKPLQKPPEKNNPEKHQ